MVLYHICPFSCAASLPHKFGGAVPASATGGQCAVAALYVTSFTPHETTFSCHKLRANRPIVFFLA
jgi:hypothetical protein